MTKAIFWIIVTVIVAKVGKAIAKKLFPEDWE
jgi:threonine/homoserine efflux transporter RhtA